MLIELVFWTINRFERVTVLPRYAGTVEKTPVFNPRPIPGLFQFYFLEGRHWARRIFCVISVACQEFRKVATARAAGNETPRLKRE